MDCIAKLRFFKFISLGFIRCIKVSIIELNMNMTGGGQVSVCNNNVTHMYGAAIETSFLYYDVV